MIFLDILTSINYNIKYRLNIFQSPKYHGKITFFINFMIEKMSPYLSFAKLIKKENTIIV